MPAIHGHWNWRDRIWQLFCFYRPQRSWAKVIFLQACVCPQEGSASVHAGICPPGADTPREQTSPRAGTPPGSRHPPGADTPREQTPGADPPPGSRLQPTVNERPVRILLECILVQKYLSYHGWL